MNAEEHNEDNPLIYAGENSSYDADDGGREEWHLIHHKIIK